MHEGAPPTPDRSGPRSAWIDDLRRRFLAFFEAKGHLRRPSAPLPSDDPTLMYVSAGMVPFKPYFLGATPKFSGVSGLHHRVVSVQKCLRINDVENVGRTLRHHSFFEMLGNFSFGDYFKSEACAWAWEFLVDELGLDPERLHVTVYLDDDEAYRVWTEEVGVPPARITRWGEDENFWPANAVSLGPNGPCGPCSEVFFDRGPAYGTDDEDGPNTGGGDRFIEVWNLVFTQFDRRDGGELVPLPQQNIDTGLGFERLVTVMAEGEDAYASELFAPTIREVARRSGQAYEGVASTSHRVIADHLRAVTFAIADGVLPANDGPGYVVKMLLRRASRHAWLLGLREPILHALVPQVVEAMGGAYPEIADGRPRIEGVVRTEEEQFLRTLEAGIARAAEVLDAVDGDTLAGEVAFDLWQTHGFPLDLTRELAAERGIAVDGEGFERAREAARAVSRAGTSGGELFHAGRDTLGRLAEQHPETRFLGYDQRQAEADVLALVRDDEPVAALAEGARGQAVLDASPFYPRGGGQVGDAGTFTWPGGEARVHDTVRSEQGLILHEVEVTWGELAAGARVDAQVDPARDETEKHHTATHLLHAALRSVLGAHVAQAGSLVAPDRLRFDLTHPQAIPADELDEIERRVNRWIQADLRVDWRTVPFAEARRAGAMMLFGEKYGDEVRMVRVGGDAPDDADAEPVSIELCGGTHVRRSGALGTFLITAEEAASSGVRRLTARTGMAALAHVRELRATQRRLVARLGGTADDLEARVAKLQEDAKARQREVAELRQRLAQAQSGGNGGPAARSVAGVGDVVTLLLEGVDVASLRNAADTAMSQHKADLVVAASDGALVVKASPEAQGRGWKAGELARELAGRAGGGGGGRPDMAQAGTKDREQLRALLQSLERGELDTDLFGA